MDFEPTVSETIAILFELPICHWGGKGETILFLTGGFSIADGFDNLAPKFTDRFHVLGLTRRGQGKSGKPESGYNTGTLVEDIKQFLDVMKIECVYLIGYSLAGEELTRFAGLYPKVRNLVVCVINSDG